MRNGLSAVAGFGLAVVVAFGTSLPARADHKPRTLRVDATEGQRGQVVSVSGENCEEDGKAFQYADLYVFDGSGRTYFDYYTVRSDGSWGGELRIPADMSGTITVSASCVADDMDFPGAEAKVRILEAGPATLSRTTDRAPAGTEVRVAGAACRTAQGDPLADAAVYLVAPRPSRRGSRPPLPPPVAAAPVQTDGTWAGSFAVPISFSPGQYELVARCHRDGTLLETTRHLFTVERATPGTTTPGPGGTPTTTTSPTSTTDTSPTTLADTTTTSQANDVGQASGVTGTSRAKDPPGGGRLLPLSGAAALLAATAVAVVIARRRGVFGRLRFPARNA